MTESEPTKPESEYVNTGSDWPFAFVLPSALMTRGAAVIVSVSPINVRS